MVTQQTRQHIWYRLLDIARYVRYYDSLATRYRRYWFWINTVLALSGTGVLATFLIPIHDIVPHIIGAVIAVLTVWNLSLNLGETVAALKFINRDIGMLEHEYRLLWESVESGQIEDAEALRMSDAILKRVHVLASGLTISTDNQLNQQCAEEVNMAEKERYYHAA